jgi:cytochrome b561
MHLALYALMIFMPLAGWLLLSAEGKPIPFFGLQLPALINESKNAAEYIRSCLAKRFLLKSTIFD